VVVARARVISREDSRSPIFTWCRGVCGPRIPQQVFPITHEKDTPPGVFPAPWVRGDWFKALDTAKWWAETRGISSVVRCSKCGNVQAIVQPWA